MPDRPGLAAAIIDPASVPTDQIADVIGELERAKAVLCARLSTPRSEPVREDTALDVKAAAARLGMTVSYLRHHDERLHAELLAATGEGFILPWSDGTVRYSALGIEALMRWRRSQPR